MTTYETYLINQSLQTCMEDPFITSCLYISYINGTLLQTFHSPINFQSTEINNL